MKTPVALVQKLLDSKTHDTGYITGMAGTGKTTDAVQVCEYLYQNNIPFVVCAYTHKACEVLSTKFPEHLRQFICTLHSFLGKRPVVNDSATNLKQIDYNHRKGGKQRPAIMILDEFSMVGEKDFMDIREVQDPPTELDSVMKVLMFGDPYQLPPVGDQQTIWPSAPFWLHLTEIKRTDCPDIMKAMQNLVSYIDNPGKAESLPESANLQRGQDLVARYLASNKDRKILAWTNEAVQNYNARIQGRTMPIAGDILYCSSNRREYRFIKIASKPDITTLLTPLGFLERDAKYKPLEFLLRQPYLSFFVLEDIETLSEVTVATVFGMKSYLEKEKELSMTAVVSNRVIVDNVGKDNLISHCNANRQSPQVKARSHAWRSLLSYKDATMQLDFNHAITVHKSQGSTYEEVYVDTHDLHKCADRNFILYLKLLYVAISRASGKVITS